MESSIVLNYKRKIKFTGRNLANSGGYYTMRGISTHENIKKGKIQSKDYTIDFESW